MSGIHRIPGTSDQANPRGLKLTHIPSPWTFIHDNIPTLHNTHIDTTHYSNIIIDPEAAAFIFDNKALAAKTTMAPLDLTHLVLARQDVQELLLYGPERGHLDNNKTNSVDETQQRKGKTTLRTMLVELLMFFAKTYK